MIRTRYLSIPALALLAACGANPSPAPVGPAPAGPEPAGVDAPATAPTSAAPAPPAPKNGVLVMAHGGSDEWNDAAARVSAALKDEAPTALAFGMANPATLRAALDSLKDSGVDRVAVVRMFLSGSSFRTQTDWLLGMSDQRPAHFISHGGHGGGHGDHHGNHHDGGDPYAQIDHGLSIATHDDGLMDAPEAGPILLDRARGLSTDPENESVLLIGHGMGEDDRNDAVLRAMARAAAPLGNEGFAAVKTTTLREDWPEVRKAAEAEILAFARTETRAGRRLLVIPFRLFGFGPYAQVLGDLPYVAGQGLLPNDRIAGWAVRQARSIFCMNGWVASDTECPAGPVMTDQSSEAEPLDRSHDQQHTP